MIESQQKLRELNRKAPGNTNTLFCGAWANYGFHEDGLTSGLMAAALLGAECPFAIVDSTHSRPLDERNSFKEFGRYAIIMRVLNWYFFVVFYLFDRVLWFLNTAVRSRLPALKLKRK